MTGLPHICHPARFRYQAARKEAAKRFSHLGKIRHLGSFLLGTLLLWPVSLSIGSVETSKPQIPAPPVLEKPALPKIAPKIAIVIDDLGNNWRQVKRLKSLDHDVTWAVIPHTRFALSTARLAQSQGRSVLLHMPMEPLAIQSHAEEYREYYKTKINALGFLTTKMSAHEIQSRLNADRNLLSYCVGINNHMGSRFTQDPVHMKMFLDFMAAENLFFLDSRTSGKSLGYQMAKERGLRTANRDVFLDSNPSPRQIHEQLNLTRELARKNGHAVAIGHPFKATLKTLEEELPKLRDEGFELVPVERL